MSQVAFHDLVFIKSWADSSSRGASIKVALPSRDSLAAFELATTRAGKRAGQRYKSVWQDGEAKKIVAELDLWFAGANWAHQDGASVKFSLLPEDLEVIRSGALPVATVSGTLIPYWMSLAQIDDDEKAIDQDKARVMDKLKGGPKSKRVAMLCQQGDFQEYVSYRIMKATGLTDPVVVDTKRADQWVKEACSVESKVDFDHNEEAWAMFQGRVMSPFLRWGENQAWRDDDEDREDG